MKKVFTLTAIIITAFILSFNLNAQNSLEFNAVLIVDNNLQTVPVGKVWKVVSVYGSATRICIQPPKFYNTTYKYNWFNTQGFLVNGISIYSEARYSGDTHSNAGHYWYTTSSCNSGDWDSKTNWGMYDINPNPNILPMWLPAGTDVQAMQGSYLSVIEFNVN